MTITELEKVLEEEQQNVMMYKQLKEWWEQIAIQRKLVIEELEKQLAEK